MTTKTERRIARGRQFKAERRRWRAIKDTWPEQDPAYLDWIRTLPCVVCLKRCGDLLVRSMQCHVTEAAHVGERGMAQKSSDREAIPLCGAIHHREGFASAHVLQKRFWAYHGLDRDALIRKLNRYYARR